MTSRRTDARQTAGDHACALHATPAEYHRAVAEYVRQALKSRLRVLCLIDGECEEALRGALEEVGLDAPQLIERGNLKFLGFADARAKGGLLAGKSTAQWLRKEEAAALHAGHEGLGLSLDMSWGLGPEGGGSEVSALEERLCRHLSARGIRALCHYDLTRFGPGRVLRALDAHPHVFAESRYLPNPTYGAEASDQIARAILDGRLAALGWKAALGEPDAALSDPGGAPFRALANAAPSMLRRCDASGSCTFMNEAWLAFTGRTYADEAGIGWLESVHPEDADGLMSAFRKAIEAKSAFEVNYRLRRRDGVFRRVMDRGVPYVGPRGEFLGFVGSAVDVTELRDLEEMLSRGKREWEAAFDAVSDPIFVTDARGVVLRCNRAAGGALNRSFDSVVGQPLKQLLFGPEPPHQTFLDGPMSEEGLEVPVPALGKLLRVRTFPIPGAGSAGARTPTRLWYLEDVTERKRAAENLEREAQRYQALLNTSMDGFWRVDQDGRLLEVNEAYATMSGYSREELLSLRVTDLEAWETPAQVAEHIRRVFAAGVDRFESRHRAKDGSFFDVEVGITLLQGEGGCLLCFLRDITERKRAEEALRDSEDKFRYIFENSTLGKSFIFPSGYFVSNRAFISMLGYSGAEIRSKTWQEVTHPEDIEIHERAIAALTSGEVKSAHFVKRYIRKDGAVIWGEVTMILRVNEEGDPIYFMTFVTDITERRRIEATMRLHSEIVGHMAEGAYLVDAKHLTILYANRRMEEIFGYGPGEMDGRPVSIINARQGGDPDRTAARIAEALSASGFWQGEVLNVRKDGTPFWGLATISTFQHPEHGTVYVSLQSDITVRKAAEEALRASQEKFRRLVEVTSDWVWEVDKQGRYTYASPRIFDLLGYTPEEILGRSPFDLMPPGEAARVAEKFAPIMKARKPFAFLENANLRKDGATVILETSGIPVYDEAGRFSGYHGIDRDVTARLGMERERRHLATAIHQAAEAVLLTDAQGIIVYANPAFERTTGYSAAEAIGRTPRLLKSGVHPAKFYEEMWATLLRREVWRGRLTNRRKDGSLYQEEATISPIEDTQGAVTGYVAVKRDVTEEDALRETLSRAREMERLGRLVGGVAHEVRNPLNAIQAATEALQLDLGADPEFQPLFEIIRSQVTRLSLLMGDLLELGKPLNPSQFQAVPLILACEGALRVLRESHPELDAGRLRLTVTGQGGARVLAEAAKLQQILLNLLDNAVHHSGGQVPIELVVEGGEARHSIRVVDAGKGMDPKHLGKVFDPFFTTRKGGTGLGLSLVRHIVEAHGGSVTLSNNQPPPGCTAEVILPAWRPGKDAAGEGDGDETGGGTP